jgi:hypothetical protein
MQEKPDLRIAAVFGVVAGFLIAVGNLYWQLEQTKTEMATLRQSIVAEVTKISEASQQAARKKPPAPVAEMSPQAIEALRDQLTEELTSAKRLASAAAQHAKVEAVTHADKLAERIGEERLSQHKEVVGELGQIKEAEAAASAKINDVTADIASIKDEVASTRQELQQTVSELKRVTGDLGVQSGYIATNARELQALKALGERNYFDFHVERTNKPQRVGDVSIVLRKTDPKRGKYTLEVLAGDTRTSKKEKSVNEPVQFYTAKGRPPCEIVVNEVQKDYIVGYLAAPKPLVNSTISQATGQ